MRVWLKRLGILLIAIAVIAGFYLAFRERLIFGTDLLPEVA